MRTPALHPDRRDRLALVGLFALALVLRLTFGVWAPLHINGQGPLWIGAAAVRPEMLAGYGPGYAEVFSSVTALAGAAPDIAIFAANATASALVPVLAFALARMAGVELDRALLGAGVLAIDPVAVRCSASESYFVPILVLTLAASTTITAGVRASARSRVVAGLWIVAAALFSMQAARIHPVAWIPVALGPLAALFAEGVPSSRRFVWLGIAVVSVAFTLWITSADALAQAGSDAARFAQGTSHRIGRPIALVVAGTAFAFVRARHGPLVLVGAVSLALDLVLRPIYGQSEVWQSCFDRLFLAVPAIAVAAILPDALWRGRMRVVVVAVVVVVAALLAWPLRTRTTEQVEYRWLRTELARLDPECRVASVSRAGRRVHYLPWYAMASGAERGPSRWFAVGNPVGLAEAARHGRCIVWLHSSLCESGEGRPACEAIEHAVVLDEIASVEIDAVPSARDYPYDGSVVRVALHRVAPRR